MQKQQHMSSSSETHELHAKPVADHIGESERKQNNNINNPPRPVIFLDIDGVLNLTKHNKQIHFEATHLKRLKTIIEKTNSLIVLSTFWRHFHEYITYVFHRHGIDVAKCMLPLPIGATRGKQTTKKFLHYHRIRQEKSSTSDAPEEESMIGRNAEDDGEYSSRAEEIEAWLKMYGEQYLGECINGNENNNEYGWHHKEWKYVILDDRPSAATPDTPLFDRFVKTETSMGLTDDDADWAIEMLLSGPQPFRKKPSLDASVSDDFFRHDECNISPDLAILLTPDCSSKSTASPLKQQQQQDEGGEDVKEESTSVIIESHNTDESLKSSPHNDSQQYESEILAAMCDYSHICPTLVALMQPMTMDDNDNYRPLPTMMKSFEEEKNVSKGDGYGASIGCDLLQQQAGSSFDSLIENDQALTPASPPPMNAFHNFSPSLTENVKDEDDDCINDIGLDDLGQRWKTSLPAAVGAPPLTANADLDDELLS